MFFSINLIKYIQNYIISPELIEKSLSGEKKTFGTQNRPFLLTKNRLFLSLIHLSEKKNIGKKNYRKKNFSELSFIGNFFLGMMKYRKKFFRNDAFSGHFFFRKPVISDR